MYCTLLGMHFLLLVLQNIIQLLNFDNIMFPSLKMALVCMLRMRQGNAAAGVAVLVMLFC